MIPPQVFVGNAWPRWLPPEDCATYVGVRVDYLPREVKAGHIPAPSYHLGPRRPRYDREAIDAAFSGIRSDANLRREQAAIVEAVIAKARTKREGRKQAVSRRHRQATPLPTRSGEGTSAC